MARGILALGALLFLTSCANVLTINDDWKYEPTAKAACYWTNVVGDYGIPCAEVEEPVVVVTQLVVRFLGPGTLGFYVPGEGVIYLSDRLPWQGRTKMYTLEAVRVHETVHYILDKYSNRVVTRCESEEMARRVTAAWEREAYDPEWEARYNCGPNRWIGIPR